MKFLLPTQLPAAVEAWTGFDTRLIVVSALGPRHRRHCGAGRQMGARRRPAIAGGIDTRHGADMEGVKRQPSFLITLLTIIFPVVLMLLKAVADTIWPDAATAPWIRTFVDFVGQPLVAMTLAVLLAIFTFGYAVGFTGNKITAKIGASLGPIAGIMLIVGAGGGFKQTLIGVGVGDAVKKDAVKKWAEGTNISVLVLGFIVADLVRDGDPDLPGQLRHHHAAVAHHLAGVDASIRSRL